MIVENYYEYHFQSIKSVYVSYLLNINDTLKSTFQKTI